jgi:transcription initiation factor TFIIIB Brf1 subunit/transcription initiation factor TFIIB
MRISLTPEELEYYRYLLEKVVKNGLEHSDKIDKIIRYMQELELTVGDIIALAIYLMHELNDDNIDLAKVLIITKIVQNDYIKVE